MFDEYVAMRVARPPIGALLGLLVAGLYWVLDGWMTPGGSGLADCAAWFGGLGFVGGLFAVFESETNFEPE